MPITVALFEGTLFTVIDAIVYFTKNNTKCTQLIFQSSNQVPGKTPPLSLSININGGDSQLSSESPKSLSLTQNTLLLHHLHQPAKAINHVVLDVLRRVFLVDGVKELTSAADF